jgi:hypothetical protein
MHVFSRSLSGADCTSVGWSYVEFRGAAGPQSWLARHSGYRQATDEDCDCAGDIQQMRAGYGGAWKPVRNYHPYIATADFNGDGVEDFAVVIIDRSKQEQNLTLIVFNGPFKLQTPSPIASFHAVRFGPEIPGAILRATTAKTLSPRIGSFRERFGRAARSRWPRLSMGRH